MVWRFLFERLFSDLFVQAYWLVGVWLKDMVVYVFTKSEGIWTNTVSRKKAYNNAKYFLVYQNLPQYLYTI